MASRGAAQLVTGAEGHWRDMTAREGVTLEQFLEHLLLRRRGRENPGHTQGRGTTRDSRSNSVRPQRRSACPKNTATSSATDASTTAGMYDSRITSTG